MPQGDQTKENSLTLLSINQLKDERTRAESLVSEYQSNLDAEQAMLDGLLAQEEAPGNSQYLMLAKKACSLGIHAWACDIEDLKHEIDMYTAKINSRLARISTGEMQ